MIAITTRSSIRVKARTLCRMTPPPFLLVRPLALTRPRIGIRHIGTRRWLVEPTCSLILALVRLAAGRLGLEGWPSHAPDEETDDEHGDDAQHRVAYPRIQLVLHEDHPLPGKATRSCLSVHSR